MGPCCTLLLLSDWPKGPDEPMSLASGACSVDRVAPKSKGCVWRVVKSWLSSENAGVLAVLMCSSLTVTGQCNRQSQVMFRSVDFDTHFFLIHTKEQNLPIIYFPTEFRTDSESFWFEAEVGFFPQWDTCTKFFSLNLTSIYIL